MWSMQLATCAWQGAHRAGAAACVAPPGASRCQSRRQARSGLARRASAGPAMCSAPQTSSHLRWQASKAPEKGAYHQQDASMHFISNARGSIPEAHDINAHDLLASSCCHALPPCMPESRVLPLFQAGKQVKGRAARTIWHHGLSSSRALYAVQRGAPAVSSTGHVVVCWCSFHHTCARCRGVRRAMLGWHDNSNHGPSAVLAPRAGCSHNY